MRIHDAELLVAAMTNTASEHYLTIAQIIFGATKSQAGTGLAMRWLLGQVLQPISPEQSREQAALLASDTLF
jgi:hypothetical protein